MLEFAFKFRPQLFLKHAHRKFTILSEKLQYSVPATEHVLSASHIFACFSLKIFDGGLRT